MPERLPTVLASLVLLGALTSTSLAQQVLGQPTAKKRSGSISGSPLDTFMHTHLRTKVPPAPDWIAATRPDAKTLDYEPLTGSDPVRPKPRDKANVMALQAELEQDAAINNAKGDRLRPVSSKKRRKVAR